MISVAACQPTGIISSPTAVRTAAATIYPSATVSTAQAITTLTVGVSPTIPKITSTTRPQSTPTDVASLSAALTPRPPGVEITSPSTFTPMRARSHLHIAVNATSAVGILQVQLYINEQVFAAKDAHGVKEFNAVFDWFTEINGDYRVAVKATESNGQVLESPIVVQQIRGGVDPVVNGNATVSEIGSTVSIPEGTFVMGDDSGNADEQPQHVVALSAFEIDRFEITAKQFRDFVNAAQYQTSAEKEAQPITRTWQIDNTPVRWDHPVRFVSWWDADAYCRSLGKRLPTEAEWEFAARSSDQRKYPWGNEYDRQRLPIGDTSPVGFYSGGASPFGLYDMAGNVWEWTEDWYDPTAYSTSGVRDPRSAKATDQKAIRGGGFNSTPDDVRVTRRIRNFPTSYHSDVGFRCVIGPE